AGEVESVEPERREQQFVVRDVIGHLVEWRVAALAEVRVVGAVDAEVVRQRAHPFEAMKGAAAVEVDQRLPFTDRVSDALHALDAAHDAFESFGAVGPLGHSIPRLRLRQRGAATDREARQGSRRGQAGQSFSALHAATGATGIAAPLISSASEDARTSAPPLLACANISALSLARCAGSLSESSRLKFVDIGEVTSTKTRRRSWA